MGKVEQLSQWVKVEQPPIHVDETPWAQQWRHKAGDVTRMP